MFVKHLRILTVKLRFCFCCCCCAHLHRHNQINSIMSLLNNFVLCFKYLLLSTLFVNIDGYAVLDIRQDEKAKTIHRLDTLNIFAYVCILILIVCTIWLFKHKRVKFIHETGLAIIYGLIVGAIIRYSGTDTGITQMRLVCFKKITFEKIQNFILHVDKM